MQPNQLIPRIGSLTQALNFSHPCITSVCAQCLHYCLVNVHYGNAAMVYPVQGLQQGHVN